MEPDRAATEEVLDDDFLFYSHLYSSITVVFAMAVFSKFLTNEFKFGFRSFLTLVVLFIGEPLCHFLLRGPSGVAIFGFGCVLVYSILPGSHLPAAGKSVLITGCDSGFGYELAKKLDSIGVNVYAGCLSEQSPGAVELKNSCSERLRLIQLDVTNEKQLKDSFEFVGENVGNSGLWGLVNNAGICYLSEIEMTSEKIFRQVLDVNLFGTINVTKTFLPLIRRTKGRIVNMSSLTGRVAFESFGAYCVSKFAIEAYSDVLRMEMRKWDVKVCLIEPAAFSTAASSPETMKLRKEEVWDAMDGRTRDTYGATYFDKQFENYATYVRKYPTDLTPVVRSMRCALFAKRPSERYVVGSGARTVVGVFALLPVWMGDRLSRLLSITAVRDMRPAAVYK